MANRIMPKPSEFVNALALGLRQRCGFGSGDRLLVACSGGADSVALLRGLHELAHKRTFEMTLIVGHVQHHLRQRAEGDAKLVASLARQLGLRMVRTDVQVKAQAGNREASARRLRYAALLKMARRYDCRAVVTAHHGEDQWETLLLRMLRGASLRGLSGMAWRRRLHADHPVELWRPLLACERTLLRTYLRSLQQNWREDESNRDLHLMRNRLRAKVLPVLRGMRSDWVTRGVELSHQLREAGRVIEAQAAGVKWQACGDGGWRGSRARLAKLSALVLMQVLRTRLSEAGVRADRLSLRVLRPLARAVVSPDNGPGGVKHFALAGGVKLRVRAKWVEVIREWSDTSKLW